MAKVDVEMPKMGESITEGTVIEWHKAPGDEIEQDETLLEIGTDKVDTEVPSPHAGVLDEVLVEAGDTVEVGAQIAVIETEPEVAGDGADEAPPAEDTDEAEETEVQDEPVQETVETRHAASQGDDVAAADSDEESDDTADDAVETRRGASQETEDDTGEEEASEPDTSDADGETTEIVMPKMGESITEGTVIEWHKAPGDEIEQDETLLEIGTDKVDTEVPSPKGGVLHEILVEEGETVEVGAAIAVVGTGAAPGGADDPEEPVEETVETRHAASQDDAGGTTGDGAPEPAPQRPSGDGAATRREPAGAEAGAGGGTHVREEEGGGVQRHGESGRFYSPLVRSIAQEEGLSMSELESIEGSGREGRVTKDDVMAYLDEGRPAVETQPVASPEEAEEPVAQEEPTEETVETRHAASQGDDETEETPSPEETTPERSAPPPAQAGGYDGRVEIMEMDRMRQITAEHMIRSKGTSAHVTSFAEADVTGLVKRRERHKEAFQEREGIKLTYTPFFVQAAIEALKEHPMLNASVEDDKIIIKKDYHVGMAVAIGQKGLMAPVIRHADQKSLSGLAYAADDLAERARSQQLQPDELQSGTFTVTNIGSLGSTMGTPIINQPQVGILATGAIKKRPVVIEDDDLGDIIAVRHIMYLSLSYDHRIIDGAMGASFLQKVVAELEDHDPEEEV
jgi:2-oxoglutarate dehydrogenase E2 component (dihydrolipoamide succinyltransferase)